MECNHPNWRVLHHFFQRGRYTTNQYCYPIIIPLLSILNHIKPYQSHISETTNQIVHYISHISFRWFPSGRWSLSRKSDDWTASIGPCPTGTDFVISPLGAFQSDAAHFLGVQKDESLLWSHACAYETCSMALKWNISGWWFGTWILFSRIDGITHPNWRTHIFQRDWNHQPDIHEKIIACWENDHQWI